MVLHGGAFFPLSLLVRAGWLNPREIARRRRRGGEEKGEGEERKRGGGEKEEEEEEEEEKRRRRERRGEGERRRGGGEKERGIKERRGEERRKVTTTGSYCTCVDYRLLPFLVSMRFLYRLPYSLRENPRQTLSIVHCSQSKG